MARSLLGILWENVPNVAWFAAVGVILQKVKAAFSKLPRSPRHTLRVRVSRTLLTANDHSEIRKIPGPHFLQNILKSLECLGFLGLAQRCREFDLPAVAPPLKRRSPR